MVVALAGIVPFGSCARSGSLLSGNRFRSSAIDRWENLFGRAYFLSCRASSLNAIGYRCALAVTLVPAEMDLISVVRRAEAPEILAI